MNTSNIIINRVLMSISKYLLKCLFILFFISTSYSANINLYSDEDSNFSILILSGEIVSGDLGKIKNSIISSRLVPREIYFDSPGGNLQEGIEIGLFLNRLRIRTIVPPKGRCLSACAVAFLGGTDSNTGEPWRAISKGSIVGFHQFRVETNKDSYTKSELDQYINSSQIVVWQLMKYFDQIKADKDLLLISFRTNPGDFSIISDTNASQYGILVISEDGTLFGTNSANDCPQIEGEFIVYGVEYRDKDGGLVVRGSPNASASWLGTIPPNGTGIDRLSCDGNWCKVRYQCLTGWSANSYLKNEVDSMLSVVNVSSNDKLIVRSGPHSTYSEIGSIPTGSNDVVSHGCQESPIDNSRWCRVTYLSFKGWASEHYLTRH